MTIVRSQDWQGCIQGKSECCRFEKNIKLQLFSQSRIVRILNYRRMTDID